MQSQNYPENIMELLEFKQPINIPIGNGMYRIVENYEYYYLKSDVLFRILVPAGFTYDGASVPRWLWSLSNLTPDGDIRAAAAVHDLIYAYDGTLPFGYHVMWYASAKRWVNCFGNGWSRKDADKLFLKIMKQAGIGETDRKRAYWAVRLFGWIKWDKKDLFTGVNENRCGFIDRNLNRPEIRIDNA